MGHGSWGFLSPHPHQGFSHEEGEDEQHRHRLGGEERAQLQALEEDDGQGERLGRGVGREEDGEDGCVLQPVEEGGQHEEKEKAPGGQAFVECGQAVAHQESCGGGGEQPPHEGKDEVHRGEAEVQLS